MPYNLLHTTCSWINAFPDITPLSVMRLVCVNHYRFGLENGSITERRGPPLNSSFCSLHWDKWRLQDSVIFHHFLNDFAIISRLLKKVCLHISYWAACQKYIILVLYRPSQSVRRQVMLQSFIPLCGLHGMR